MATIGELWVYPVKACRGVQIVVSKLTKTGLEFDRTWCIVDRDGTNIPAMEFVSQRKMPQLATIEVGLSPDRQSLLLNAPGMPQCVVPTDLQYYATEELVEVECGGKSTSTGGGWTCGSLQGRVHAGASFWLSTYLNREAGEKRCSGFSKSSRYSLVRSISDEGLSMESYTPFVPWLEKALAPTGQDSGYRERIQGNAKRFADISPLLLLSRASARVTGDRCGLPGAYPLAPFRGNIIVDDPGLKAWDEETWRHVEVTGDTRVVRLTKIKECIRCTVPCRDGRTGGFLVPEKPLTLWKSLKTLFPRKFMDPEWGSWNGGPFFGTYFGAGGCTGVLKVGDRIVVTKTCRWDEHLQSSSSGGRCMYGATALAVLGISTLAILRLRRDGQ